MIGVRNAVTIVSQANGLLSDAAFTRPADGSTLTYTYDTKGDRTGITALLNDLQKAGLQMADLETVQSSLEDIFVGLVKEDA